MALNEGFNGGHFTLMAPGHTNLVLTIANGTHWAEVRPDNVIAVDLEGRTVEGSGQIERSAFHIHSALHRARPDLRCFLHAHMPYATALSMLKDNRLKTFGQQALRFYSKCTYTIITARSLMQATKAIAWPLSLARTDRSSFSDNTA